MGNNMSLAGSTSYSAWPLEPLQLRHWIRVFSWDNLDEVHYADGPFTFNCDLALILTLSQCHKDLDLLTSFY